MLHAGDNMKVGFTHLFAFIIGILVGLGAASVVRPGFDLGSILSLFSGSPAPISVPAVIYIPPVERIQALAQLSVVRFNYARTVTGQQDMPALLAPLYAEGVVMVAVGHIDAGIDVSAMTADDLVYAQDESTLTVFLPAPALQTCFLDEQKSYVVSRQSGIFASPMRNLESHTRLFALRQYRDLALEDGILDEARIQAETVIREFLGIVSGADLTIQVEFRDSDPDAALPESCQ
jgi:hypothetical protein